MKRSLLIVFALLILVAGCVPILRPAKQPVASATNSHKILLMLREVSDDEETLDYMLNHEVGVMVPMLEKAGYDVTLASASGEPLTGITTTLPIDMKLTDVNVNDYAGYVIPCMAAGSSDVIPPEFLPVVQKAMATGRPLAAQQSGSDVLYTAGVLKGKHYAAQSDLPGATNMGNVVVQDGNLITSGVCPNMARNMGLQDGTPELMQKFIAALGSAQ